MKNTTKDRWSQLSMQQRADLIKLYVGNNITNIRDIRKHYNSFAPGGPIEVDEYGYPADITAAIIKADYPRENEVWKRADDSNADMVQRLRQGSSRATIQDWEDPRKVATHKMMSAGNYVVGNVQNINGQLFDFTDPKHGFEDPNREVIDSAIERGDYIKFDTEGDARYFAEHYKKHYNSFGDGGNTNTNTKVNTETKRKPLKELFDKTRENKIFGIAAPIVAMQQMLIESKEEQQSNEELAKELGIDYNGEVFKIPDDLAERNFITRANEQIKTKTDAELKNELRSKSYDDLISIQNSLASEGYYDISLKEGKSKQASEIQQRLVKEGLLSQKDVDGNIGEQTITALQTMLVKKGYLPEFTDTGRKNIDGLLGKRTQEAFKLYNRDYNIDGQLGSKTINAYLEKENKKQKGFNIYVSAEGMQDQCAAWVSKKFDTVTGNSKQNGVYGNAWQMLKNVEDAGGQMLFNLYEDDVFSNMKSGNQIKNTVDNLVKTKKFDYSQLQAGDVVGIHNPSSLHYDDVLKEGTTYNTHVGIIVDVQNGIPIVEHNIGGKVRRERIDKLTGSLRGKPTVTVASRPKQGENLKGILSFDNIKSDLKLPTNPNKEMQEYMNSLASSKSTFKQIYPSVDMDFIEKAAVAITKRETNFMEDKQSDVRRGSAGIKSAATANLRSIIHAIEGTPEESKSQDLTKMKYSSLGSQYRAAIGLTNPEQLSNDPTITGRAVMLLLSKNYDYFQRLAKENPSLNLTEEDIRNATILSYNRGLGSTATLGFNKDGSPNFEEIKYLREKSKIDAKEKDISATNLKYLFKLGDSAGIFGNWLYDNYGEEHTPYVAAANKILQKLDENN